MSTSVPPAPLTAEPASTRMADPAPLRAAHTPNFPALLPGGEAPRALAGLADTAERPEPLSFAFAWRPNAWLTISQSRPGPLA